MKHTRLALVLAITSFVASPAFAASVTMLQFGSFETRDEAQKRLDDVTSKHKTELAALPTGIREVKLPPDNLTVYRTQAGPVDSRATAQAICAKLASSGDECYIVQTAMTAGMDTKAPTVAVKNDAAPLAADVNTADTSKSPAMNAIPGRDTASQQALASVSAPQLTNSANAPADKAVAVAQANGTAPAAIDTTSPDASAALDKAVAAQPTADAEINAATAAQVKKDAKPSFWSHLNPFSDSKPAAPAPAPVKAAAPAAIAAPVDAVEQQSLNAPTIAAPVVAAPAVAAAPVVVAPIPLNVPSENPPAAMPPMPVAQITPSTTNAVLPEPMHLPPPPAPLKAQDRAALSAPRTSQAPEAIASTAAAPVVASNGSVNVEEAKRVPVTDMVNTPTRAPEITAVPVVQPQPTAAQSPSATDGLKTIWAQVGPFYNNDAALSYWNNYRQSHPDFPVVRVRVTTPYIQQIRGENQAWLRIGPVTQIGFVKNLCANLVPNDPEKPSALKCGAISDLGISSSLKPTPGYLPASRYAH